MEKKTDLEVVHDVRQACTHAGFKFSTIVQLDVEPETLQHLKGIHGRADDGGNEVRLALEGSATELAKEAGTAAYTLVMRHSAERGQVVGGLSGELMEARRFNQLVGAQDHMAQVWSIDIPAAALKRFGYKGEDLVLSTYNKSNEFNFAQDGTWWRGTHAKNNVQAELRLVRREDGVAAPHVVYVATRKLKKGEELSLAWGDDCWRALSQIQVVHQGLTAQQLHHGPYAAMRALCRQHGVEPLEYGDEVPDALTSSDSEDEGGPVAKRRKFSFRAGMGYVEETAGGSSEGSVEDGDDAEAEEEGEDEGPSTVGAGSSSSRRRRINLRRELQQLSRRLQSPAVPPETAFKVLSAAEVQQGFPNLSRKCDFSRLPTAMIRSMDKVPATTQLAFSRNAQQVTGLNAAALRDPSSYIRQLIDMGTCPKLDVAVLMSLHHPVRFLCPPDCKYPKTALAAATIQEGEPIGIYVGRMHLASSFDCELTDEQKDQQLYAYDLEEEDVRLCIPFYRGSNWIKTLVVENLHEGNETRFINDCYGRHDEETAVNAAAVVFWDPITKRPYVLIYAAKKIPKGEEIVLSYGAGYWRFVAHLLQREQFAYYDKTMALVQEMQRRLRAAGVPEEDIKAAAAAKPELHTQQLYKPDV